MKVVFGDLKIHKKLNEDIWEDFSLKEGVKGALLKIAEEFYAFLEVDAAIKNIKFTGSLANYNYTTKSDIDLHLVINFEDVDENVDLVKKYFDTIKNLWNNNHNISVHGYEVELYVENEGEKHISTGVYSLSAGEWMVKPKRKVTDVDVQSARYKADKIKDAIDSAISMGPDSDKLNALINLKNKIKKMRRCGLEKGGEFSAENVAFKFLRHEGALAKLYDSYNREYDKQLSLPEAKVNEEESYQKAVKKSHSQMKYRLIGRGKNKKMEKGHTKPSYKRSKSAPPGAGGT